MIWNFNPILFEAGPLHIYYYGVCFALGLALTYGLTKRHLREKKLPVETLDDLTVFIVIGLILGARLGHVFFYEWDFYREHLAQIPLLWKGGLSSHGGILGTLAGFGFYFWRNPSKDWRSYADSIAVSSPLMIVFIRLGNFFNSEILGRPTDMPWGVTFERIDSVSRHPSQLYEMTLGLVLLALLTWAWNKGKNTRQPGFFTGLFFFLYGLGRFDLEYFKDLALHPDLGLTTGQLLSLPLIVGGAWILVRLRRKK